MRCGLALQAAAEAAELLVRGFAQQQAGRSSQPEQGSLAQQVLQSPQSPAGQHERRQAGLAGCLGEDRPQQLPVSLRQQPGKPASAAAAAGTATGPTAAALVPPAAAPALSTHSQSRSQSQQSRRSKAAGAGAGTASAGGTPAFAMPRGKAAKAAQGDATLHPILRMGWQPLCSVVCNGLRGEFLGGHGMDLYIRCTAPQFAALPLIDVNLVRPSFV